MIYVAAPYSRFKDKEKLMKVVSSYSATLLLGGEAVICPLTLGHNFCKHQPELEKKDSLWWLEYCYKLLGACNTLYVLMLPGWETSVGVQGEIEYAKKQGIRIAYVTFDYTQLSLF